MQKWFPVVSTLVFVFLIVPWGCMAFAPVFGGSSVLKWGGKLFVWKALCVSLLVFAVAVYIDFDNYRIQPSPDKDSSPESE